MSRYRYDGKTPGTSVLLGSDRHMGLFLTVFENGDPIANPFDFAPMHSTARLIDEVAKYTNLSPSELEALQTRLEAELEDPGRFMQIQHDYHSDTVTVSTIIAALRYFQENREDAVDAFEVDHFADVDPMTDEQIDAFVENLNFSDIQLKANAD
jgi:hypothetical protein